MQLLGQRLCKTIICEPEDVASLAKNYANHIEAMSGVFDHIVSFHNSMQLHSKRGNLGGFNRSLQHL